MTNSTLRHKNRRNRPMPTAPFGPSASTIQLILGYSKALQVVDAPPIGRLDLVLN